MKPEYGCLNLTVKSANAFRKLQEKPNSVKDKINWFELRNNQLFLITKFKTLILVHFHKSLWHSQDLWAPSRGRVNNSGLFFTSPAPAVDERDTKGQFVVLRSRNWF